MARLLPLFLVLVALLAGCAKRAETAAYESRDDWAGAPPPAPSAAPAPKYAKEDVSADEAAPERSESEPATTPADAPVASAPRMVHYAGWLRLRVTRIEAGVDAVTALAATMGGKVEQIGPDFVSIRVPVARFREAFAAARALGEPLDESISAQDVTEAFVSTDLRLRTARATRDRLQALLARSQDEQEKLQLLREIQRVGEQIDELEAQLATLASLASLSRITVELVPREALAWQGPEDETAELAWIRGLSPFRTDFPVDSKKLDLPVPEGMVRLEVRGRFVAESADGARAWTHRVENEPEGDAAFWLAALEERLARDFAKSERLDIGAWRVLRLVDRSDAPYTWWIAVRVDGGKLHVAQALFPSAAHEERHGAAVRAALVGEAS